jgi:hypothetical protein
MEYRKLTEREEDIITQNLQDYTRIFGFLRRHCEAPGCGYPMSALNGDNFSILGIGNVCGLCYAMYAALTGQAISGTPGLKNIFYFKNLHDKWKKDNDLDTPGRRDRLGL